MKYRILGKTRLKVSVIGIGTWQFGGEWGKDFSQPEVDALFDRCRELGINLIDTAECYGDHLSETLIGPQSPKTAINGCWRPNSAIIFINSWIEPRIMSRTMC